MYTKDAIRFALQMADRATMDAVALISHAPLTFPTGNGGCHPLWVMGHLAFIEGLTHELLGGSNPVPQWGAMFGQNTVPSADASQYPEFETVREQYVALRKLTFEKLEAMTEADLDTATPFQPPGLEEELATHGRALLTVALHQMAHRGHLADAARAAGRTEPAMA